MERLKLSSVAKSTAGEDAKKWGLSYQVMTTYLRTTMVEDMLALPAQLEDLYTLSPSTPLLDIEPTEICAPVHWESHT